MENQIIPEQKKILFSAVQPSGTPTLGNYIGALSNFTKLQNDYRCIFSLADLHSITVAQDAAKLRANTYDLLALYLACGINPEESIIFNQSHVSAHAELAWVLNTITYVGELSRMTQFKAKCQSHADNINMGLMDYPVLMAADILLYQTELVPVGADQKQHLELARDLAIRFNNRYGDTFAVPEPYIAKSGARVMSLADPTKKMSKSDENVNGFISMNDDPDTIMRKFRRAVTDSDTTVRFDKEKPGISNLLTIYSVCADVSIPQAEAEFAGVGYGDFKQRVGEAVVEKLRPIQDAKKKFAADKAYLTAVMAKGAENAERIAYKTLRKVYKKVGFVPRERV